MNVVLQMPGASIDEWERAFARALPEARISRWPDVPADPDFALVWKPPAEFFARVQPARAIVNLGAGVDALLAVPNLPPDVPILRLEDAGMAAQMAEYVTLAALRAFREADAYASQQREGRWQPRRRMRHEDFGVGIMGFGVLGRTVHTALAPFGFPIAAWGRTRKLAPGVELFAGLDELPRFLARTRLLACLLPSTPETRDLLDRRRLEMLAPGAHVVNVARGDIVVDEDLIALIDSGHLAGATLDVFRTEPLPPAHAFWHHPRVTMTPHISAITKMEESVEQIAAKLRRIERGESVTGVVDRARGY